MRYYEEEGLVRPAQRTEGGFRLYSEEEIARLELIKKMKPLGFTIQEMKRLLDARDDLATADPSSRKHENALDSLSGYADVTGQKIDALREQLASAESFTGQLRSEVRRHRRRATISSGS